MAPLIAAALGMAPAVIELLAGKRAGGLVEAAAEAMVGTSDPAAVRDLPPDQQAALRQELARIALEVRRAELADTQHARDTGSKSGLIAWAQVIGGAAVLLTWVSAHLMLLFLGVPPESAATITLVVSGISTAFGAVMQFFFGNSTAASAANRRLDTLAAAAPVFSPPAAPLALPAPSAGEQTADTLNAAALQAARRQS